MSEFEQYRDLLQQRPLLVILVGESGVGKSTFAQGMNLGEAWIISSDAIKKEVSRKGFTSTHDNIHVVAKELYQANPYWQTARILSSLKTRGLVIYDGPRKLQEVQYLVEYARNRFIVEIIGNDRLNRLRTRDDANMTAEDMERIKKDELTETELNDICKLADITIYNTGTIEELWDRATTLRTIIVGKNI